MKRTLLGILLSIITVSSSFAIPSYPKIITLSDGMRIFIKGDENYKWGNTEDGYTIFPKDNEWVYAKTDDSGYAIPSDCIVKKYIDENTQAFLSSQPLNIPVKLENKNRRYIQSVERKPLLAKEAVGERKALVVLMAFTDLDFIKSNADFDNLFNEIGYSEDGAMGSVKDYFLWSSYGQLNFSCDIIGPFPAKHEMRYYGRNFGSNNQDKDPFSLFEEALEYAKNTVDLSIYDSDKDGFIDNFHIIFAGHGEESGAKSDAIWSHEMTFPAIDLDGLHIDRYSCAPELRNNYGSGISRIGPHCHEMGHALGAMDYYDVDYSSNGSFPGTGNWDIMASGSWNNEGITPPDFNPYVKIFDFGWVKPQKLVDGYNQIYPSIIDNDQIYLVETSIEGDFFLIENRQKTEFDSGIPDSGLVIFHIGPEIETRKRSNNINSFFPQQCYVVCSNCEYQIPSNNPASYGDINSEGCTYPSPNGNAEFSDSSTPAAFCFDGSHSYIRLSDIKYVNDSVVSLYNGTPPLPTYLISENFESGDFINSWHQEGNGWIATASNSNQHNFNGGGLSSSSPIKHDSHYLYTKFSTSFGNKQSIKQIETSCLGLNEGGEYQLELEYYNSSNIVSDSSNDNVLRIYLKTNDGTLILLKELESSEYKWLNAKISFAGGQTSKEYSIVFEGRGSSSGYICIDNLKIEEKSSSYLDSNNTDIEPFNVYSTGQILIVNSNERQNFSIYSTDGRVIQTGILEDGTNFLTLPKGVYILYLQKNQNRSKIIKI